MGLNPLLIALVIAGVMGVGLGVQTKRLESCKAESAAFVAKVEAAGREQERRTKEKESADIERKEKADAENKRTIDSYRGAIKRLRDSSSSSGVMPKPTTPTSRPDLACYGRSSLDSEIREFTGTATEVLGILGADAVGLNTARQWAQPQ